MISREKTSNLIKLAILVLISIIMMKEQNSYLLKMVDMDSM